MFKNIKFYQSFATNLIDFGANFPRSLSLWSATNLRDVYRIFLQNLLLLFFIKYLLTLYYLVNSLISKQKLSVFFSFLLFSFLGYWTLSSVVTFCSDKLWLEGYFEFSPSLTIRNKDSLIEYEVFCWNLRQAAR